MLAKIGLIGKEVRQESAIMFGSRTPISLAAVTSCGCLNCNDFVEGSVTRSSVPVGSTVLEMDVERIYDLLLAAGYPVEAIDWLRQHTLVTIWVLAVGAWLLLIALGWAAWTLLI